MRARRLVRADRARMGAPQTGTTAPIVGASKMEQLDQAVAALDITLAAEDLRPLEDPYESHPVRW
jgi:1-deoxyxylulose-5-phosphate synthase